MLGHLQRNKAIAPGRSQPRLRSGFGWLLLLAWLFPSMALAASFTATLDRDSVAVGESATLSLKFEGGQPSQMPSPPRLPNLQIASSGSSRNINIVNGQFSSTISEDFVLTPTQPGVYAIPAMRADIGGQILTTPPLKLTAVKSGDSASNNAGEQLAFFKLFVPRKEVYVGEVFEVEFRVYVREGVANAENVMQSFENYGGCPIKVEDVSILKTAHANRRRMQVGNGVYTVATLVTALSPVKPGTLSLGSWM